MKSLSRVIKNSDLVLSSPLVLNSFEAVCCENQNPMDSLNSVADNIEEPDELEMLKIESQKIMEETQQVVVELLEKARSEARFIIGNAQEEADLLKAEVYKQAEKTREEARTQGHEDGIKQAEEEMKNERETTVMETRKVTEDAYQKKSDIIHSAEGDIIQLVTAVSEKVIASELTINPLVIVNVVRQCIQLLDQPDIVDVYVNPEDLQTLLDAIDMNELVDPGSRVVRIDAKADRRISQGGCIMESDAGNIDAQIESRIEKIEESLIKVGMNE
ncbi:MAG: FliH/SctL family protein [Bacillota bacterium]|nr:FliH/SctL family protein [Bacillota bacterium]